MRCARPRERITSGEPSRHPSPSWSVARPDIHTPPLPWARQKSSASGTPSPSVSASRPPPRRARRPSRPRRRQNARRHPPRSAETGADGPASDTTVDAGDVAAAPSVDEGRVTPARGEGGASKSASAAAVQTVHSAASVAACARLTRAAPRRDAACANCADGDKATPPFCAGERAGERAGEPSEARASGGGRGMAQPAASVPTCAVSASTFASSALSRRITASASDIVRTLDRLG